MSSPKRSEDLFEDEEVESDYNEFGDQLEDVLLCDNCHKEFSVDVGIEAKRCPHCGIKFD